MQILVFTTTSFAVFLLFLSFYLTWKYKRERSLANQKIEGLIQILTEESDNQKEIIYRNMHDHVNPMLRFVVRNMELHRSDLKKKALSPEVFEQDIDVLLMALNDIRSCTHGQVPESLKAQGYVGSLENILRQRSAAAGIGVQFQNKTSFKKEIPFDELRQLDLHRISSEIIENILRHTHCNNLEVTLAEDEGRLSVHFIHDGKGLTNEEAEKYMNKHTGVGLKSCKTRALLLNAEINYYKNQQHYFTELTVPFQWKTK